MRLKVMLRLRLGEIWLEARLGPKGPGHRSGLRTYTGLGMRPGLETRRGLGLRAG